MRGRRWSWRCRRRRRGRGCAAARVLAPERRRSRYGARTPAGSVEPGARRPAGRRRRSRRRAAGGRRRGPRSCLRRAGGSGVPPTVAVEHAVAAQGAGARDARRAVSVPRISAMPTARRCRAPPRESPQRARRISSRNRRPVSGRGSATGAAGRRRPAATATPSATSRTRVGRRTPGDGVERERARSSLAARPTRATPSGRRATSRSRAAVRAVERARARGSPGRPSKRPGAREARRAADQRGRARRRAPSAAALAQPSSVHVARRGRRRRRARCRSRRRAGRARARPTEAPRRGSRRNGSSPVVRWKRYVSAASVPPRSACSASTGGRSASRAMHARDPQLADAAGAVRRIRGFARGGEPHRERRRRRAARAASRFQPGSTGNRRPGDLDRQRPSPAVVVRAAGRRTSTSRGASKRTVSTCRSAVSARSACQCVAGSPSSAANGRCSGNCGKPGEDGARTPAIPS